MFKLEKGFFDYFNWLDIENKYTMKYKYKYGEIEEEFINDLLKYKVISVKYNDVEYFKYQDILDNTNIQSKDIVLLRTLCKHIYDKDIYDNSDWGKMKEKYICE